MGCYYTLYLNTYGCSLLFYKVYHEEGECRQLEFWLEKEQTLETYSAQLQKSWNSTKPLFGFNKNLWAKEIGQGAHTLSRRQGGAAPYLLRPLVGLQRPSYAISSLLPLEKLVGKLTRRNSAATRRNLGEINLGLWRSFSTGDTSLREGEIITNVITNDPLNERGSISINIFTSTISSQNPSSSVVSNLVSKPQIGTYGLLVVLITTCSWCYLVYLVEDHMFRSFMHIITPMIVNMNMLCE